MNAFFCFLAHIASNPFQYVLIHFNTFKMKDHKPNPDEVPTGGDSVTAMIASRYLLRVNWWAT